jgi:hypothetical protein
MTFGFVAQEWWPRTHTGEDARVYIGLAVFAYL